jgi:hypothetical protein
MYVQPCPQDMYCTLICINWYTDPSDMDPTSPQTHKPIALPLLHMRARGVIVLLYRTYSLAKEGPLRNVRLNFLPRSINVYLNIRPSIIALENAAQKIGL